MGIKSWKNRNYMLTRRDILNEAIHKCLVEMYKWSQPTIDLDKLIADGYKDSNKNPLYKRHYLSEENFMYLRDIYKDAYGIVDNWNDTFDILIDYLVKGGLEDDYKPATKDRPGYRDYKKVPALETIVGKGIADLCLTNIKKCRDFYMGHSREVNQFDMTIALGVGSPNSCAKVVEEYWHNNGRPSFTIKEFKIDDILYNEEYPDVDEFLKSLK